MGQKYTYWQERIMQEMIIPPGKHILTQGYTGAGKTNLLNWLVQGFFYARSITPAEKWDTIVWFDRGKSSEILSLAKIAPLRLILPEGCQMEVNIFDDEDPTICDIEQVHFSTPGQIWHILDRDRINIICIQRFLIDPSKFSAIVAKIFKSLIIDSFNYNIHPLNVPPKILLPRITIFIDEINNLAPSKGQGAGTREEAQAGAWIQQNIEQLRSQGIRLIGSVHGWRKVRPGVRSSFPCHIALPGAYYPASEKPKLSRFNPLFEKLEKGQACFIFEQDVFSDPFKLPFLGDGKDIGFIKYHGQMKGKASQKPEDSEEEQATERGTNTDLTQIIQALKLLTESKTPIIEVAANSEKTLSGGLFE